MLQQINVTTQMLLQINHAYANAPADILVGSCQSFKAIYKVTLMFME